MPKTARAEILTGSMRMSGYDNVAIGYEALSHVVVGPNAGKGPMGELGWPPVDDASIGFWICAYCGQSNAVEREGCRGCQAPRAKEPKHTARACETTYKGVPLSELTEEEREEMREWLSGPEGWRCTASLRGL